MNKKNPLRIEFYYAIDGYVVKLYRGYSTMAPCLETGLSIGPENPATLKAAICDLHTRWNKR